MVPPHNHGLIVPRPRIPGGESAKILPVPDNSPDSFMNTQPRSASRVGLRPGKLNSPYFSAPRLLLYLNHMESGHVVSVCKVQLHSSLVGPL